MNDITAEPTIFSIMAHAGEQSSDIPIISSVWPYSQKLLNTHTYKRKIRLTDLQQQNTHKEFKLKLLPFCRTFVVTESHSISWQGESGAASCFNRIFDCSVREHTGRYCIASNYGQSCINAWPHLVAWGNSITAKLNAGSRINARSFVGPQY